jgi:hypothetical protein
MARSRGPLLAAWLLIVVAGCAAAGCASDPLPPAPIRPIDKNVVLAWTIEDALYDHGLARATEVVTFRYEGDDGLTEVQDYGRIYRGDQRPRTPTIFRRRLTATQMDQLQHVLAGLELPDVNRRQERPMVVPWTMWGICVPVTRGTQCGQLLVDEWRDVDGASVLFALLQSFRRDARLHPEK